MTVKGERSLAALCAAGQPLERARRLLGGGKAVGGRMARGGVGAGLVAVREGSAIGKRGKLGLVETIAREMSAGGVALF